MNRKLVIVGLSVTIIAVLFVLVRFGNPGGASALVAGDEDGDLKTAPDFTLVDIYGKETSLSDFKDKVIILDFWATWCPPCRQEIPHFIELYNEYKDEGLEVIGVALDSNAEKTVRPFSEKEGINYTILVGNREVTELYGGIMSIPTTFIIDREGRIKKRYVGYRDKKVFEDDIKELLEE